MQLDDRPRPARRNIPKRVKLAAVQRQGFFCKCGCGQVVSAEPKTGTKFDHRPPLRLRDIAPDGLDYDPPQNSAAHIDAICRTEHDRRTFGTGASTAGTDTGLIKKERKRNKVLAGLKKPKTKWPKGRKMQSRGFAKKPF